MLKEGEAFNTAGRAGEKVDSACILMALRGLGTAPTVSNRARLTTRSTLKRRTA